MEEFNINEIQKDLKSLKLNVKNTLLNRAIYESQTINILSFIYINNLLNERNIKLIYYNHKYLIDILEDVYPKQVYMKSAQVGISISMILKVLWLCKYNKYNIIYTLPTVEDLRVFVPSKVNPIIQNNPVISAWVKDKDSVETKQVSGNFIFFRGTWTVKEALMLSSDLNVYDEMDRSDLENISAYSSRLKYSNYAGEWFLSNPSAPTAGVGEKFSISSQNHWFVVPECGHWQYLDWEKNVDRDLGAYVCEKCHRPIKDEERGNGRWVEKFKGKEYHGYWINQMMCPWIKCKDLLREEEEKDKAYFYNFVLGKPYLGSDIVIDASLILKNVSNVINSKTENIMGVDQGLKKHFVLGNKEGIFEVGSTKDWNDIENIRNKYDAIMVMDALPDLTVPRQLREKYPHKVYLCYYHKDKDKAIDTKWGKDKDWGYVWADRNRTLQNAIDYLSGGKIKFQMDPYDLSEFVSHWKNMYKMIVEDSLGVPKFVWEASGPDHLCHSLNYWLIGLKRFSEQRGSVLRNTSQRFHGEESFEVTNDTMPGIPLFEKEPRDWRYV